VRRGGLGKCRSLLDYDTFEAHGWMADGIHDFTVINSQKNPSEHLIISWIASTLTEISEEMICFQVYLKRDFLH